MARGYFSSFLSPLQQNCLPHTTVNGNELATPQFQSRQGGGGGYRGQLPWVGFFKPSHSYLDHLTVIELSNIGGGDHCPFNVKRAEISTFCLGGVRRADFSLGQSRHLLMNVTPDNLFRMFMPDLALRWLHLLRILVPRETWLIEPDGVLAFFHRFLYFLVCWAHLRAIFGLNIKFCSKKIETL